MLRYRSRASAPRSRRWSGWAPEERKSKAGRKPYDAVLMFKVLVLQMLYNLADAQLEYQVRDRLTFARFLGLELEDQVPDATTARRWRRRG